MTSITQKQFEHILRTWTAKKIDNIVIDDLLNIENVPLWWFYERLVEINFLPFENNMKQMLHLINSQEQDSTFKKIQKKTKRLLFQRYLIYHEQKNARLYSKYHKIKFEINHETQSTQRETKDIVFLSYLTQVRQEKNMSNISFFRLDNLLNAFEKNSDKTTEVIVIANPNAKENTLLTKVATLYPYLTTQIREQAAIAAKQKHQQWKQISPKIKQDLLTIHYIKLYPYIENYLQFLFSYEFMYLTHLYYYGFKEYLQQHQTKAVVLTAISSLYEKCLLAAASSLRIHSYMVQHGIATGFANNDIAPLFSITFCVMGPKYKQDLLNQNIPENTIKVTGPLIFDEIIPYLNNGSNESNYELSNKSKDQNLSQQNQSLLFMTSPVVEDNFLSKEEYFKRIKIILEKLIPLSNLPITIKLHPREQYAYEYQRVAQELGMHNVTISTESTRERHFELIRNCSAFLNFGSTTALEAMMLGKPIVTIDPFDEGKNPFNTFIRESDATSKVRYDADITACVQETLDFPSTLKKQRERFVHEHCSTMNGNAPQRIVNVILETIDGKKETPKKTRAKNVVLMKTK
ncbi:UDP-N-acetylglucosamine 2-epimerase [Candidatus Woesearchaeota archaeon]|nr:UDP-N-acetylglucosamine 2-epimerase [Candidatus Woesearchaeota archaeon]